MARSFFYSTEAAALLGWSTQWLGRKIHRGELPATRFRQGRWRITRQALSDFAVKEGIVLDWDAFAEIQKQRDAARLARSQQAKAAMKSAEQQPVA